MQKETQQSAGLTSHLTQELGGKKEKDKNDEFNYPFYFAVMGLWGLLVHLTIKWIML
jgi:hypothetical protein